MNIVVIVEQATVDSLSKVNEGDTREEFLTEIVGASQNLQELVH